MFCSLGLFKFFHSQIVVSTIISSAATGIKNQTNLSPKVRNDLKFKLGASIYMRAVFLCNPCTLTRFRTEIYF